MHRKQLTMHAELRIFERKRFSAINLAAVPHAVDSDNLLSI